MYRNTHKDNSFTTLFYIFFSFTFLDKNAATHTPINIALILFYIYIGIYSTYIQKNTKQIDNICSSTKT